MSALAPTLQAFFTDRLVQQHHASPHTIAAYRDAWRLLLRFAATDLAKAPSQLEISDLDAPFIGRFLAHLEQDRANTVRTRNARLSAIHALFRYAALEHPEQAAVIARVLAIPPKRGPRRLVSFLSDVEVDALLAAPDRTTWTGRRDHTLLALAIQTGLRVSELTGLQSVDLHLARGPHVNCVGKGRKQRITPLTKPIAAALQTWLAERAGVPDAPVFPTRTGQPLSRDAIAQRLATHVAKAAHACPSLGKKTVTPHTLRHTAAMRLLHAGVDTAVIALWLGHENVDTTNIYIHADLALKERAIDRTTPAHVRAGRYRPPDTLLAFLEGL
ncbi:MAG: tyrosine-type recombinase/integrase [Gammaproteobacteria bacterium]|nr:tyrosine-type recombinase/integrase [Gammaproteobacteria bacterium]